MFRRDIDELYLSLVRQEDVINNLSQDKKRSIQWYSGPDYNDFNIAMRNNRSLSTVQRKHKENIEEVFDYLESIRDPLIVFKGIKSENVFSDKSFVSTTLDYEKTSRFRGNHCCVLVITVSPGSKVLPIRSLSDEPDEEEVLLDKDGTMVVTGSTIKEDDNMKIIYVSYFPKESKVIHNEKDLSRIEKKFDNNIIIQRIVDIFKHDDKDFLDDETIKYSYRSVTDGKELSEEDLIKIKKRLGI